MYSSVACLEAALDRPGRIDGRGVVPWDQNAFSTQYIQVPKRLRAKYILQWHATGPFLNEVHNTSLPQ